VRGILILLPVVLALGGVFAWLFFFAVKSGQFDDLDDPPVRMLHDDDAEN
jgi:cbb3-type cytochrome oxidase maturation protein